jgi:hypothetical protein
MDITYATRRALESVLRASDHGYNNIDLAAVVQELRRRDRLKAQNKPFRIKK